MKRITNFMSLLILILLVILIFCFTPVTKIEAIGDFFEKILYPIGFPLSLVISAKLGYNKYKEYQYKKKDKSP